MSRVRSIIVGLIVLCGAVSLAGPASAAPGIAVDPAITAAFEAVEKGRWSKAMSLAARSSDRLSAKVITWMVLSRAQPLPPFGSIADFIKNNPDWPGLGRLRQRAEAAMDATVNDARVFAWFSDHSPLTGLGKLRLAEAYLNGGDEVNATTLLREAWVGGRFSAREEKTFLKRHRKRLRMKDHVARLDRLIWDRQRRAAQRMLRRVDAGHRALGIARLRLMVRASGVDAAIAQVPKSLRNDPGLWYERLRWRRRKGRHESAREILANPPHHLVRPEAWWKEAFIETRKALSDGLISVSYRLASEHRQSKPLPRSEAEWLAGWIALRFLDDPELAYPHFTTLHDGVRYPISVARGAYWAGRAAAAMGKADTAREWYERAARHGTTFYGQLASAELGRSDEIALAEDPEIAETDTWFISSHELTKVVHRLADIGQERYLRSFIMRLDSLASTPGEHMLVAALARAAKRIDLAVAVARRGARHGISLIEHGFPVIALPRNGDIAVEPALVLAILRQESGFYGDAVSSAGARGLMQIMPRTARGIARKLKLPFSAARLTGDPTYNLTLGQAYLDDLLDNYEGSYVLALAAYNAGSRRVRRWIAEYGDPRGGEIAPIDWIEMIPLSETRNYVQRVLETLVVYRHLGGQPAPANSLALDLDRGATTPPSLAGGKTLADASPSL